MYMSNNFVHSGNLRTAWQQLKDGGGSERGRGQIRRAMQLCPAASLTSTDEVDELAQWAQNAFDYLVSSACCSINCDCCCLQSQLISSSIALLCTNPRAGVQCAQTRTGEAACILMSCGSDLLRSTDLSSPDSMHIVYILRHSQHIKTANVWKSEPLACTWTGHGRLPLPLRVHAERPGGAACISHAHSMSAPQQGGLDWASPPGGAAPSCGNLLQFLWAASLLQLQRRT